MGNKTRYLLALMSCVGCGIIGSSCNDSAGWNTGCVPTKDNCMCGESEECEGIVECTVQMESNCDCGEREECNVWPSCHEKNVHGDITEDGSITAMLNLSLCAAPSEDGIMTIESMTPDECTVSTSTMKYTAENWSSVQSVEVKGVVDGEVDGTQVCTIQMTVKGVTTGKVLDQWKEYYSVLDSDSANILVVYRDGRGSEASNPMITSEDGDSDSFKVALSIRPKSDVTVNISLDKDDEHILEYTSLVFTPDNWNAFRSVRVTGIGDDNVDGDQLREIYLFTDTTEDENFSNLEHSPLYVLNRDTDSSALVIRGAESRGTQTNPLLTSEDGGTDTFTVALQTKPKSNVTVRMSSSDTDEGLTNTTELVFTPENWNAPQTVRIDGVDDEIVDGPQSYQIQFVVESEDEDYNGMQVDPLYALNADNDSAAIVVLPAGRGTAENPFKTNENGDLTDTVRIRLQTKPSSAVTIKLGVMDRSADGAEELCTINDEGVYVRSDGEACEVKLSHKEVTFTPDNWNAEQEILVTGQVDHIEDGDQLVKLVQTAIESEDSDYSELKMTDLWVQNLDNDAHGINQTQERGKSLDNPLLTDEEGASDTYIFTLNSRPTADVKINVVMSEVCDDPSECEIRFSPKSIVFTPDQWNSQQTLTVIGQDDNLADGTQTVTLNFVVESEDPLYNEYSLAPLYVANADNDVAGIQFVGAGSHAGTEADPLETSESGTTDSFSLRLSSQPTADVTIKITQSEVCENPADCEIALGQTVFTFTKDNWNAPQVATVIGQNDDYQDGNQIVKISIVDISSEDPNYVNTLTHNPLFVRNLDNDTAGIVISNADGRGKSTDKPLRPGEDGTLDTFTVSLQSKPTANVTVTLVNSNEAEASIDKTTLTFTPDNWNAPQTVTVSSIDDDIADGDIALQITVASITSDDSIYNSLSYDKPVYVLSIDDDSAGIAITPDAVQNISEEGTEVTYKLKLNSEPTSAVTIDLSIDDLTEAKFVDGDKLVSTYKIVIEPENWKNSISFTVRGIPDSMQDGTQKVRVKAESTSSDPNYNNIELSRELLNKDIDSAGINFTCSGDETDEARTKKVRCDVSLKTLPYDEVTVTLLSSNAAEGLLIDPLTTTEQESVALHFTADNWNVVQSVNVIGVDDMVADGTQVYSIKMTPTSTDAAYNTGIQVIDMKNLDNDSASLVVTQVGDSNHTTEDGATVSYKVKLHSQPTSPVTIVVKSLNVKEGKIVDGASLAESKTLTFNASNWNTEQTVTVQGVDDKIMDGAREYSVSFISASSDSNYNSLSQYVTLINDDNDTAAVLIECPKAGSETSESGEPVLSCLVSLATEPVSEVSIAVSVSDDTEVKLVSGSSLVSSNKLTFDSSNYSTAQTVEFKGVKDNVVDGTKYFTLSFSPAGSTDSVYASLASQTSASYANLDIDLPAVSVSTTPITVSEDGVDSVSIPVVLGAMPEGTVTVSVSIDDDTEAVLDSSNKLTFTASNYNTVQYIKVKGVHDYVADGDQPFKVTLSYAGPGAYGDLADTVINGTCTDIDHAGIIVTREADTIVVNEDGLSTEVSFVLTSKPVANVTISVDISDKTEAAASPTSVTFTPDNWKVAQKVIISGVDDSDVDGIQNFSVTPTASSADPVYDGNTSVGGFIEPFNGICIDNDSPATIVVNPYEIYFSKNIFTATFSVVMTADPGESITFPIAINDSTAKSLGFTLDKTSVTFNSKDFYVPQVVTVSIPSKPGDVNGDFYVTLSADSGVSSSCPYNGVAPHDVVAHYEFRDICADGVMYEPGIYKLQAWGASGGKTAHSKASVGLGGYASGYLIVTEPVNFIDCSGGAGEDINTTDNIAHGGKNGGGNSGFAKDNSRSHDNGAGGGASDIRIGMDTYYHRIIVAGAGGGNGCVGDVGGYGGGLTGGDATGTNYTPNGKGGTQTAGGASVGNTSTGVGCTSDPLTNPCQSTAGTFGQGGAAGQFSSAYGGGGGGGGWYGGSGGNNDIGGGAGGGGGSGYVLTATSYKPAGYALDERYYLVKTCLRAGNQTMPTKDNSGIMTGNEGAGKTLITKCTDNGDGTYNCPGANDPTGFTCN